MLGIKREIRKICIPYSWLKRELDPDKIGLDALKYREIKGKRNFGKG